LPVRTAKNLCLRRSFPEGENDDGLASGGGLMMGKKKKVRVAQGENEVPGGRKDGGEESIEPSKKKSGLWGGKRGGGQIGRGGR